MKPANRRSDPLARWRAALTAATVLTAAGFTLAGSAVAVTQRTDFSSLKDWYLKAENIVPHGINPLYYPIVRAHERSDHPDGKYRKETVVLDDTADFDLPGIGKFKTAVVQEEEYIDGLLTQRALNWFALDTTNNSVYVFGEVSWEIDEEGKLILLIECPVVADPMTTAPHPAGAGHENLQGGNRVRGGLAEPRVGGR